MNIKGKFVALVVLLCISAGLIAQSVEKDVALKLPFRKTNALPADLSPYFSRENLKNDSLIICVPESELDYFAKVYPGAKKSALSPELTDADMACTMNEALEFQKYPTYEQYDSMMHYFAESYPEICRVDTFGVSQEGRLLLAVKISDNVSEEEDEPAFLYTSTMHGDELVGYVLTLRLIDFLLQNYGSDIEVDRVVNDLEIWINPLSNPDYTYYGSNKTVANSIRPNQNQLDHNRNYPDASLGEANDTAGLIPEIQNMMLFLMEHEFNMSANLHSGAELVNYPWDFTYDRHPDDDWFRMISREYADECHAVNPSYLVEENNGITHGGDWYIINHGRQDYVNCYLHGRELTLELSNIKQLPSYLLDNHWSYNQRSLLNYMLQATYGIHGKVQAKTTGEALEAKIWVLNHDNDYSWVKSDMNNGNFYRYLKEGYYDLLISSEGYSPDTLRDVHVVDYQKNVLLVELNSKKTQVDRALEERNIVIYPNPVEDVLYLNMESGKPLVIKLSLYGLDGRIHGEWGLIGSDEFILDLSTLQSGVYVLSIENDAVNRSFRIIKN